MILKYPICILIWGYCYNSYCDCCAIISHYVCVTLHFSFNCVNFFLKSFQILWGQNKVSLSRGFPSTSTLQFSSITQSCLTLCNSMDCSPWNFPSENTGVGCHFLLLGIFPTQVSCTASRFFTFWATRDWESQSEELTLSLGKTEHKQREHASKHVQNTGRFTLQEASSHIILMANPVLDTPNLHTRKQRHKETQKSLCTLSPCDTN